MSLGSAGENGSLIDEKKLEKYLVKGYLPTIGIECHVQLNTKTKLFSSVNNDARLAEPNEMVSAVDYALPGMLPVLNRDAVVKAARAGKALNSEIARESRFDRKHYFYPDLPKGYQISQMYQPIIIGGHVDLPSGAKVRIHHAHLEEDAGKLTHFSDYTLVDLNRAGTPLIEIVAEPDIHSAGEAREYAEGLHGLMTYADVTDGDLYHGNMRFDVNISIAKSGEKLGTRIEIKNLNSFRSVERATTYEINRQIEQLEKGEIIKQETRGWLDDKQKTVSQRSKEDAQDYRYMPDADVPPVILNPEEIAEMQKNMPILPSEYRTKFKELGVDNSVIKVVLSSRNSAEVLNDVLQKDLKSAKKVANYFGEMTEEAWGAEYNAGSAASHAIHRKETESTRYNKMIDEMVILSKMVSDSEISSNAGKEIFVSLLVDSEGWIDNGVEVMAKEKGLIQSNDTSGIEKIVDEVLATPACAKAVADFKNGEEKVIGFLVGQVMKASKGQANPSLAQKLIREKLQ
ncbi:Asp-tRNA(Asn)/Glu-tRNA(Gln) amidotransferase subunit GatB [Candidatus Saccharibacteria bacterium]|nr:Asp-tRNA(Asn)/Glu-tRNA(Gln) amidotransferase subunit GatB [Candidatus Saccharibacteria bacterium]